MRERWLEEAVKLAKLPPPGTFPRNIVPDALAVLPVSFVPLDAVTSSAVRAYFARRRLSPALEEDAAQTMHGCMVAFCGKGFLFYARHDAPDEQRFTLAHELAHFVLDHLQPREKAEDFFGKSILDVLNDQRLPTREELLTSALDGVPTKVQVHLMERDVEGSIATGQVARSEQRADRLAFEWLAPESVAMPVLKQGSRDEQASRLQQTFGLPPSKAETYARVLRQRDGSPRFSLAVFLGEEGPR